MQAYKIHEFPKLEDKLLEDLDTAVAHDISGLMHAIPTIEVEDDEVIADQNPFDVPHEPLVDDVTAKVKNMSYAEYRSRLVDFYKKYNPEQLDTVDSTLKIFKGKEEKLFQVCACKHARTHHAYSSTYTHASRPRVPSRFFESSCTERNTLAGTKEALSGGANHHRPCSSERCGPQPRQSVRRRCQLRGGSHRSC